MILRCVDFWELKSVHFKVVKVKKHFFLRPYEERKWAHFYTTHKAIITLYFPSMPDVLFESKNGFKNKAAASRRNANFATCNFSF